MLAAFGPILHLAAAGDASLCLGGGDYLQHVNERSSAGSATSFECAGMLAAASTADNQALTVNSSGETCRLLRRAQNLLEQAEERCPQEVVSDEHVIDRRREQERLTKAACSALEAR